MASRAAVALRGGARPSKLVKSPQFVSSAHFRQMVSHPGHGLTARSIRAHYQAAEYGEIAGQCDLFEDTLETDAHLASAVKGRIGAVAGKEFVIQPGADDPASVAAAEAFRAAFEHAELNLLDLFEHLLEAPMKGFSAAETRWIRRDGMVVPAGFELVPHRQFRIKDGAELELMPNGYFGAFKSEPLRPYAWAVWKERHTNLGRAGLLRGAVWWSMFKRMSMRDWVILAEKFGIPFIYGRYRAADESHIDALKKAVEDIGEAGQAVLPENLELVVSDIAQRSGDAESLHPSIIRVCNSEISKLITGATQNVETGTAGSYAQANVHEGRSHALALADGLKLSRVLRRCIAQPFVMANGFDTAVAPKIHFRIIRELDPKSLAEVARILDKDMGIPLDVVALVDELGFRLPPDWEAQREERKKSAPAAKKPEKETEDA